MMDFMLNVLDQIGFGAFILVASTFIGAFTTFIMIWYTSFMTGIQFQDMPLPLLKQARNTGFIILLIATILLSVYTWIL